MAQHGMTTGDHINGVTTNGDDQPLLIQHNTILNNYIQTDAVGLFQDFSDVSNVTINNNFLACGGYTIYAGTGSHGPTSGIVVTNNTISTTYYPHVGRRPRHRLQPRRNRQRMVRQHLHQRPGHPRPLPHLPTRCHPPPKRVASPCPAWKEPGARPAAHFTACGDTTAWDHRDTGTSHAA